MHFLSNVSLQLQSFLKKAAMPVGSSTAIAIVLALSLLITGCQATEGGCQAGDLKIGMVSDVPGVADAGVNESTWQGMGRADEELPVCAEFIESRTLADYEKDITEFAEQDYDLVVTVGSSMADATAKMAGAYSNTMFATMDLVPELAKPNVQGITFNVDETGFLAGYLAAAWADLKDPDDPRVAWLGGDRSTPEVQSVVAYEAGVATYNDQNEMSVQVVGEYLGTREDPLAGSRTANLLIDEGVDVVFGLGGDTGIGGLTAAKERGKWGIGSDLDQFARLPNEQDILLTSCIKRFDNAIYALIESVTQGDFGGGGVYTGTLANDGVGLAPFHNLADEIPDYVKRDLEELRQGIIDGTVDTGW